MRYNTNLIMMIGMLVLIAAGTVGCAKDVTYVPISAPPQEVKRAPMPELPISKINANSSGQESVIAVTKSLEICLAYNK